MKKLYMSIYIYSVFIILFTGCEKELFVEPKNQLLKIEYGKIYISSKPAGASIYINGRNTGYKTPDTVRFLEDGNANVVLKMKNFWDTTFTLRIQKHNIESIEVDYYANPKMYGSIVCVSKPVGAAIYVNKQNTGRVTPDTLERMFPGDYEIKYSYPEFRKDSINTTVRSRTTIIANLTLEDTLDIITYNPINSKFPAYLVNEIAEDKNGNIWIATATKGLVKFDGRNFTTYKYGSNPYIPCDMATQVKIDRDDNIWVGFSNGLVKYKDGNWEKMDSREINDIHIAYDNTMLAATDEGGIIRYKNGRYDFLTKANSGLPSDWITAICMDKQGKIWAGLKDYGIGVYDGSSWIRLDSAHNGLPYDQICAMALSPEGRVVSLFYQVLVLGGAIQAYSPHTLAEFDGSKWVPIITNKTDLDALRQIYVDKKNTYWFNLVGITRKGSDGSLKGIKDIVRKNIRRLNTSSSGFSILSGDEVFIDSKENLWIMGTGLVKIKKGRWSY